MAERNKRTAVFGIYSTRDGVERAMDTFLQSGFTAGDISVLLPESLGRPTLVETSTVAGIYDESNTDAYETPAAHREARVTEMGTVKNTKAPEGATAGASTGAVIGGALGALAGIGALAIPGIGPLLAAGPLVSALAGIGAGGVVGGFTGALIGMGIPEFEAKKYEGRMMKGGILLAVHCDTSGETKRAQEIMEDSHAKDISTSGEASSAETRSEAGDTRRGARRTRGAKAGGRG
jgi:hypothetical protein